MPELELNPETVQNIIDKVHEFHSREDVTFPDENEQEVVNEDFQMQFATDFAGDPYYNELKNIIDDLEPDQQISLVALMWIGRGDFSLDEWDDAIESAEDMWTDHTAEYLIGTPLLADFLQDALQQFEVEAEED